MVITNLKDYSDEEVIDIIKKAENKEIPYTLSDLKQLLAEATNRKIEQNYINTLANIMQSEITGDSYIPSPTADSKKISRRTKSEGGKTKDIEKIKTVKKANLSPTDMEFGENFEKYPVLDFLSGLYKVLAWFLLIGFIALASAIGYIYLKDQTLYLVSAIFSGIFVGVIVFIFLYARAEKIALNLEIEKHLRKISKSN